MQLNQAKITKLDLPPRPANSSSKTGEANLSARASRYSWTNAETNIVANTAISGLRKICQQNVSHLQNNYHLTFFISVYK